MARPPGRSFGHPTGHAGLWGGHTLRERLSPARAVVCPPPARTACPFLASPPSQAGPCPVPPSLAVLMGTRHGLRPHPTASPGRRGAPGSGPGVAPRAAQTCAGCSPHHLQGSPRRPEAHALPAPRHAPRDTGPSEGTDPDPLRPQNICSCSVTLCGDMSSGHPGLWSLQTWDQSRAQNCSWPLTASRGDEPASRVQARTPDLSVGTDVLGGCGVTPAGAPGQHSHPGGQDAPLLL